MLILYFSEGKTFAASLDRVKASEINDDINSEWIESEVVKNPVESPDPGKTVFYSHSTIHHANMVEFFSSGKLIVRATWKEKTIMIETGMAAIVDPDPEYPKSFMVSIDLPLGTTVVWRRANKKGK